MTAGATLARGTVLNLLGQGLPLIVALGCLPIVVGGLGPERFGVLALGWTVIGYAGAFDLGLGRAAARFIATALARGAAEEVPRILGTTLLAQLALGLAAGAATAAIAPLLVADVFALPAGLQSEGRATLQMIGLAVPIVLLSGSLRGALYAAQRFDLVNAVLVPSSSSMYLLSAAGVLAGWTLPTIVALLVASKATALLALWKLAERHCPGLRGRPLTAAWGTGATLFRFGSWVTVSSALVPLLQQAERLVIPAFLSIGALAFYVVPYEALSRATILPSSMALTLFSAFSRFDGREGAALTDLVARPMRYLLLITTPIFAFTALFAGELLAAWVGPRFAAEAAVPLQLLAVAFYLGGFAHILRSAVQGLGRPDLKAGLDLANAGLFLVLLLVLTPRLGVAGAAVARLAMAGTELTGLVALASRVAPGALAPLPLARVLRFDLAASASFAIAAALAAVTLRGSPLSYVVFAVCATAHLVVFWKWSSDARDRRAVAQLRDWLGRRRRDDLLAPADAGDAP